MKGCASMERVFISAIRIGFYSAIYALLAGALCFMLDSVVSGAPAPKPKDRPNIVGTWKLTWGFQSDGDWAVFTRDGMWFCKWGGVHYEGSYKLTKGTLEVRERPVYQRTYEDQEERYGSEIKWAVKMDPGKFSGKLYFPDSFQPTDSKFNLEALKVPLKNYD